MAAPLCDRLVGAALAAAPRASDVLCVPGRPVQTLVDGGLLPLAGPDAPGDLTPEATWELVQELLGDTARLAADLAERGACDLSYRHPDGARFRVNIFRALHSLRLVLRRLPGSPPALDSLGLPPVVETLAGLADGLVLVVGATGSGKSTTLAALLSRIADTRPIHAVTLEDPVEFLQAPRLGLVSQRELGTDFPDFAEGLRSALRQAPQVLLVGETRDRATVDTTLAAAETGHLVLATTHTDDCAGAVTRLLAFFGPDEQELARSRLTGCLRAIIAQRLLPRLGGGRVLASEVLAATLRVRQRIAAGETATLGFQDILEQGATHGMVTFDASIARLFAAGVVDEATALARATDRAATARALDAVKAGRGQAISDITGLILEGETPPAAGRGAASPGPLRRRE
jgi:twitching motility protein PilT